MALCAQLHLAGGRSLLAAKPFRRCSRPSSRRVVAAPMAMHSAAGPTVAAAASGEKKAAWGSDEMLEQGRREMRSHFDVDRWVVHRSTDRYFRHMAGIFKSRVLQGLFKPLAYVISISAAVCAYGSAMAAGLMPAFLPAIDSKIKELFGMTSFALALLLVFRTNASYGRWDEGRKMWGLTLNRTRDICRLGLTWIPEEKRELRAMLCRWAPAFMKAHMCHLRKGDDIRKELEATLLPHEVEAVLSAQHRPNYVLQVLSQIVKAANLPTAPTLRMEENITTYEDCLGGCERLLRTPIPLFYTRHTSRFLMIWLTCLPAALFPSCGLATIPLTFLIAFLLLGIDKIGVSIEEPFSILALENIAETARQNVVELARQHGGIASITNPAGNSSNGNGAAAAAAAVADDVSAASMVALATASA